MPKNVVKNLLIQTLMFLVVLAVSLTAQNRAGVSATNLEASKPAAYIFEVVFESEVRLDSRIDITFPKAFNAQMVMMAASEKLDGNLTATVKDNVVSLMRQNAESIIAAGEALDIKLASIINASPMDQEWEFTFTLFNGNNEASKQTIRSRVEQFTE